MLPSWVSDVMVRFDGLFEFHEIKEDYAFLSQKTVHSTLPTDICIFNILSLIWNFHVAIHALLFWFQLIRLTPLVLHLVLTLFDSLRPTCDIPLWTTYFQFTENDILFCVQINWLRNFSLKNSCKGPRTYTYCTWLVTHVIIITAEMYYPLPDCTHVQYLISIIVQQVLMDDTDLLCTDFQIRCHLTRPLLSCYLKQDKRKTNIGYWQECSTSTAEPPTSASDIRGHHNKILLQIINIYKFLLWNFPFILQ